MTSRDIIKLGINITKMKKNKIKVNLVHKILIIPSMLIISVVVCGSSLSYADSIQQQIDSLNAQNSQVQNSVNDLQLQSASYQDAINKVQAQISAIQAAISANETKQTQVQAQVIQAQNDLNYQKQVLGELIKTMYVSGQMTTVEMLATSRDLSSFVDAETYRSAVQSKIQNTLQEISIMEAQLKDQKAQIEQLLGVQRGQQTLMANDETQQSNLLTMNQDQQAQYNQQISNNKSKLNALVAEQIRINAQNSRSVYVAPSGGMGGFCDNGSGNGGYPMDWCNSAQDTIPTIPYSNDPINRECTSFAYWHFTSIEGYTDLNVQGNAKDWAYTANRPTDNTPAKGAMGVSTAGPYGHVMIILATEGQGYPGYSGTVPTGEVLTMSMNYDYAGHFHYDLRNASSLYYIH